MCTLSSLLLSHSMFFFSPGFKVHTKKVEGKANNPESRDFEINLTFFID